MDDVGPRLVKRREYGFNNGYEGVFTHRKEELAEFAEIDPEQIPQDERDELCKGIENQK
eukprot:CAMPEP_0168346900 /NCGR_PEP_ID=MMETSP0213-20121227/18616_1 /TAXON_ID=151035 /ORGANISM="Euplotes harpa, Strain FSP1.4" /LENGTH=58 /DNA_ID=CAMNT_0008355779 /DNA_START=18 /DNA_END=191 /DNA_ORIENTATION=+